MIEQYISGKTSVFIDASNIYYSGKSMQFRIDYRKLYRYFHDRLDIVRVFFYMAYLPSDNTQKRFLEKLTALGYCVKGKEIKEIKLARSGGFMHKGNSDVELTIDAINSMADYCNFILLSGDSDFAELLRYLKKKGKRVLVMSTKKHVAVELLKEAKYIDIKKLKSFLEYKKVPARGG